MVAGKNECPNTFDARLVSGLNCGELAGEDFESPQRTRRSSLSVETRANPRGELILERRDHRPLRGPFRRQIGPRLFHITPHCFSRTRQMRFCGAIEATGSLGSAIKLSQKRCKEPIEAFGLVDEYGMGCVFHDLDPALRQSGRHSFFCVELLR